MGRPERLRTAASGRAPRLPVEAALRDRRERHALPRRCRSERRVEGERSAPGSCGVRPLSPFALKVEAMLRFAGVTASLASRAGTLRRGASFSKRRRRALNPRQDRAQPGPSGTHRASSRSCRSCSGRAARTSTTPRRSESGSMRRAGRARPRCSRGRTPRLHFAVRLVDEAARRGGPLPRAPQPLGGVGARQTTPARGSRARCGRCSARSRRCWAARFRLVRCAASRISSVWRPAAPSSPTSPLGCDLPRRFGFPPTARTARRRLRAPRQRARAAARRAAVSVWRALHDRRTRACTVSSR